MIPVGEKRHFRHRRKHARSLSDHALIVDDGVARPDAGVAALVDEHLLAERIAAGVQNFDGDRRAGVALLHGEQRLQSRILFAQLREALRGRRLRDEILLQLGVVVGELPLRTEVIADERERFTGKLHRALEGIEDHRDDLPHAFEIAKARVGEHQCQREHSEEGEPQKRARPAIEEIGRLDGDVAHQCLARVHHARTP